MLNQEKNYCIIVPDYCAPLENYPGAFLLDRTKMLDILLDEKAENAVFIIRKRFLVLDF